MTDPMITSLIRPFTKLASAIFENSRPKPAPGEIFDSFGFRLSAGQLAPSRVPLGVRSELAQHAPDIAEEAVHHRADDDQQDQEADDDRERHGDEVDLHLRHQPRQHAERDVEYQTEYQERPGQLD